MSSLKPSLKNLKSCKHRCVAPHIMMLLDDGIDPYSRLVTKQKGDHGRRNEA